MGQRYCGCPAFYLFTVFVKVTEMDGDCIDTMAWYYSRTLTEIEAKVRKVWVWLYMYIIYACSVESEALIRLETFNRMQIS